MLKIDNENVYKLDLWSYKPTKRDYFLARILASLVSGDDHGLDLYVMKDGDYKRDEKIVDRAISIVNTLMSKEEGPYADLILEKSLDEKGSE